MARALELARQGIGLAAPNPCVGAVVVNRGEIAGEGTHTYAERKHAEVLALEHAGERARGGTLYLNLEPCCHQGRTGPCTEAVIAAGISRVVAAMTDPNPLVAGQGFAQLQAAGIEVVSGIREAEARKLNEAFACWVCHRRPLVTLKAAMTLDAKIAPAGNRQPGCGPVWITGETARTHVQELRHQSDAILVGLGTVLADDPLLTDRSGRPRRRPLLRVVLDSRLRLPLDSRLVQSAREDVVVFCSAPNVAQKETLQQNGVRVEAVEADPSGRPQLSAVLRRLGELEILSLLIEGGSQVNSAALSAGIVDKLFLYYAPIVMGECQTVPFAAGMQEQSSPARLHSITLHQFGEDFAVEGYLKKL
jgi:diaminohydroxyphosphoribosylaminopyrimidine deaminase/5-amino-6-(5-phosphoribosylamino)uracil reductase